MNLITVSLVRDEMSRFLAPAVRAWAEFSDDIIVLDDNSEDGSFEFLDRFGVRVFRREAMTEAWGAESHARQELFEIAWSHARIDDWLLWLDADMVPARDPRSLLSPSADALLFPLFDLWEPDAYREDNFWRGHLFPRVWAIRKTNADHRDFTWNVRGIHCGHLPNNLSFTRPIIAPSDFALLHYAYVAPELREEKYVSYARVAAQLSEAELAHARTILDPDPRLLPLPFVPTWPLVSSSSD